jgi:SNF2 family DNA or RNA helicase
MLLLPPKPQPELYESDAFELDTLRTMKKPQHVKQGLDDRPHDDPFTQNLLTPNKKRKKEVKDKLLRDPKTIQGVDLGCKLECTVKLVQTQILPHNESTVIFCSYTTPLYLLNLRFRSEKVPCFLLTGNISCTFPLLSIHSCLILGDRSRDERSTTLATFKKTRGAVLLASLKVGGVGLNLTEACCVLLLNPDWNPQNDRQVCVLWCVYMGATCCTYRGDEFEIRGDVFEIRGDVFTYRGDEFAIRAMCL